jgi:hypothetical protein
MIGGRYGARDANRLPGALLAYSIALAAFLLVPPYLRATVGPPAGFTLQEAVDLLTPLVVIPLAWLVIDLSGGLGRGGTILFLVIAVTWVEGQAIHLAANAIGDAADSSKAFYATVPGDLDHWLDEVLGHWLWHGAWAALSLLILAAGARPTAATGGGRSLVALAAGLVHGAVFFVVSIEGSTAALGIPFSILVLAWSAAEARRGPAGRPVIPFFAASAVITLVGYLAWAAMNGWTLPEFSAVGLFG